MFLLNLEDNTLMNLEKLIISNDGTVVNPSIHDAILTNCSISEKKLVLCFCKVDKTIVKLYFGSVSELSINFPEDFLVFRFSCFDINNISEKYFYFGDALKSLGTKKDCNYLINKYSVGHHLFYFEGGMGGSISFLGDPSNVVINTMKEINPKFIDKKEIS